MSWCCTAVPRHASIGGKTQFVGCRLAGVSKPGRLLESRPKWAVSTGPARICRLFVRYQGWKPQVETALECFEQRIQGHQCLKGLSTASTDMQMWGPADPTSARRASVEEARA